MNQSSIKKAAARKIHNNPVLKGTLILTLTGIITRLIGFYNRIFLSKLIGAKELGIYQLIFPLYMVVFSLTTMGNELAVTKLVSEYIGRNDRKSAALYFKICFMINLISGTIAAALLYFKADLISLKILNATSCGSCIKTVSLGIPFMAMKGAIHGYFLGLEKSEVHGISDFTEQLTKVLGLYLIATYISVKNNYSASFAVIGIVLGEVVSFFYSLVCLLFETFKNKSALHGTPIRTDKAFSLFIKNALPLTANRFALTLLQSAEAILIPSFLLKYYNDSSLSLSTYGTFTGMAFPFIMFPATLTNSLSIMLLPAVSGASSELKTDYLNSLTEKSIRFCLLIGLFSGITFYIFGNTLGLMFFKNKEAGIFLYQLSFLCPLIYLATTLASILNGLGYATHNLLLTGLSTGIRLGFIIITIPRIGISGYAAGLFVSYLFLTFASVIKLKKHICFELKLIRDIISPAFFFICTAFISFIAFDKLSLRINAALKLPCLAFVLFIYSCVCFLCFGMSLLFPVVQSKN